MGRWKCPVEALERLRKIIMNFDLSFYKGKKGKYGLGLAIAKAVAEAHDGSVCAYNKQQHPEIFGENVSGAVFDIVLPYIPSN